MFEPSPKWTGAAEEWEELEMSEIELLWRTYRDHEHHDAFNDEEWAKYKKMFKRYMSFPEWLVKMGIEVVQKHSEPSDWGKLSPEARDGMADVRTG